MRIRNKKTGATYQSDSLEKQTDKIPYCFLDKKAHICDDEGKPKILRFKCSEWMAIPELKSNDLIRIKQNIKSRIPRMCSHEMKYDRGKSYTVYHYGLAQIDKNRKI